MPVLVASLVSSGFVAGANNMMNSTKQLVSVLVNAQNAMQAMENTLVTSSGSLGQARIDIDELSEIATRLGVNLEASVIPFAKLAASTDEMSRSQLFGVFEGFSTALAATHASAEKVQGTFLALQQMASKGVVSMQDLRRQLGEHIPGAMAAAAEAMGMGMDELVVAVRRGTVDATELLTKMGDVLQKKFAAAAALAAQSLKGQTERLRNSMLLFEAAMVESEGAGQIWADMLGTIREELFENEVITKSLATANADLSQGTSDLATAFIKFAEPLAKDVALLAKFGGTLITEGAKVVSFTANVHALAKKFMFFGDVIPTAQGWIEKFTKTLKENKIIWDESITGGEKKVETFDNLADSVGRYTASLKKAATAAEKEETAIQKTISTLNALQTARAKAESENQSEIYNTTKDVYEKTGKLRDEYFALEKAKLKESTEGWTTNYGIAEEVVNKFVADSLAKIFGQTEKNTQATVRYKEAWEGTARVVQDGSAGLARLAQEKAAADTAEVQSATAVFNAIMEKARAVREAHLGQMAEMKTISASKEQQTAYREAVAATSNEIDQMRYGVAEMTSAQHSQINIEREHMRGMALQISMVKKMSNGYTQSKEGILGAVAAMKEMNAAIRVSNELIAGDFTQHSMAAERAIQDRQIAAERRLLEEFIGEGGNINDFYAGQQQDVTGTSIYINQMLSRSDIVNITNEQERDTARA